MLKTLRSIFNAACHMGTDPGPAPVPYRRPGLEATALAEARERIRLLEAELDQATDEAAANFSEGFAKGREDFRATVFLSQSSVDVMAERRRQVDVEGWSLEHDDDHEPGDLAGAAGCYAYEAATDLSPFWMPANPVPVDWPFESHWWKPDGPRRNLVKAAALCIAEIDRLDRAARVEVVFGDLEDDLQAAFFVPEPRPGIRERIASVFGRAAA